MDFAITFFKSVIFRFSVNYLVSSGDPDIRREKGLSLISYVQNIVSNPPPLLGGLGHFHNHYGLNCFSTNRDEIGTRYEAGGGARVAMPPLRTQELDNSFKFVWILAKFP